MKGAWRGGMDLAAGAVAEVAWRGGMDLAAGAVAEVARECRGSGPSQPSRRSITCGKSNFGIVNSLRPMSKAANSAMRSFIPSWT